ncbi:MAG: hypothetical protein M3N57_01305, partial [Actinomycetota bacterium]|nr:hypothetical protein [Actinomycetota bacterium]
FPSPAEAPPRAPEPSHVARPTAVPSTSEAVEPPAERDTPAAAARDAAGREERSAGATGPTGPTSPPRFGPTTERRIKTDPGLDEETLDRLIAGVKAL